MRLYSRTGAGAVDDPEFGHFEPDSSGGFHFPNEMSDRLHGMAIRGERLWEDDLERQARLMAEEAARRADPRTLLAAVEQLVAAGQAAQAPAPPASAEPAATPAPEPAKTSAKPVKGTARSVSA